MKILIATLSLCLWTMPSLALAQTSSVEALTAPNASFAIVDSDGRTIATLVSLGTGELRMRTIAATVAKSAPALRATQNEHGTSILTPQQEMDAANAAYERTFGINHSP